VFIDETGVNKAVTRLYARALKGKRAYGKRPDKRGKNVTLVGAIALKGMIAALTFPGGTDRESVSGTGSGTLKCSLVKVFKIFGTLERF
jgi:hypothetical protein